MPTAICSPRIQSFIWILWPTAANKLPFLTGAATRLFALSVSEKYKVSACVNPLATLLCNQQNQTPRTCNFDNEQR
ncbi:hypothetical protein CQJ27_18735 [Escherichia sp. E1130]|nr:hypothetical protein CQB02_14115 [Escherichia coli]TGB80153.1 hypothetical protein CRI66_03230 [Escherichia sp. E4694]TGB95475.1 hypothetical protein CRG94_05975 [Escherichia sp. E3356]TGC00772.1 hypothetical protein CRG92_11140 [Escherichia sp. E2586]TGC06159.1 hypothetical protein CRG93_21925 [Escherichia sp. E2593]TGC14941.1 hypothetical protein CRU79_16195 [Escherichia sp. E4385]TGC16134.1 hypothetical protein CQJ28_16020 [Escherichia sp. E2562]TGC23829.1 hypothetical protein CQJ27_18